MQSQIKEIIATALKNLGIDFKPEEISLEHPTEEKYGDYSTNVALKVFKTFNELKNQNSKIKNTSKNSKLNEIKSPNDLARVITEEINSMLQTTNYVLLSSVSAVPPGFINFKLSQEFLTSELKMILKDQLRYGLNQFLNGKNLMVEFAHPNTHKMFHIGHLRNITTGEAMVRILEANGAKVTRANYQGDVGLHIAKCLYGIYQDQKSNVKDQKQILKDLEIRYQTIEERMEYLGKVYAEGSKAYEEDETAKKEINALNTKIYNKDPLIYSLYQETRQWSLDYFNKIYKRVDSKFDRFYFESETFELGRKIVLDNTKKNVMLNSFQHPKGILNQVQDDSSNKGIFQVSQGAVIFDGEKYGLHKRVFINSEGNPTYEAKDMGLAKLQFNEYNPDLIIHVVAPEQAGYFKVIFKAINLLFSEFKDREFHLIYGWVKLKNGKMSSRLGNVVLGEWLLDELKKKLKDILKNDKLQGNDFDNMVESAAVAAAKYSFLKVSTLSEIAFDIDESVNLQGDSGPYIQYTYARTQSVLGKMNNESRSMNQEGNAKHNSLFIIHNSKFNPEELAVLRLLYKFSEVVLAAGKSYSPCIICEYLFDLCQKFNAFYNKHRILNAESEELINQRLAITEAVGIILKNGLTLLGIKSPSKM